MSLQEFQERPAKKRRFFLDETSSERDTPPPKPLPRNGNGDNSPRRSTEVQTQDAGAETETTDFDPGLLQTIVGQTLDMETIARLRDLSSGDLQRAINIYLDGSWKSPPCLESPPSAPSSEGQNQQFQSSGSSRTTPRRSDTHSPSRRPAPNEIQKVKERMPEKRYIGSFGVVCWATRSGSKLIKHGEQVRVGRVKHEAVPAKGSKARIGARKRQDNIVRFTNSRNEEVGRLETETSAWLAPLLDQRLCEFDGTCVFAPDHVRTNDTIYLQLQAYFLASAFEASNFILSSETNRTTGIFEAKETQEERNLHLRQLGLVKLFTEINMNPSKSSTTTEKHKRQGILRAAEVAEQYEVKKETSADSGGSSPPSEDAEEGEELEQDQLDTLYKKAQSFDFNTPEYEPAKTFAMDLRKYQKQALHWLVGKEMSAKEEHKEMSMHPLWEEYNWPIKDADDHELPQVEGQFAFYINPYSGELSLDFPVQQQNCLGGILADEMGLGKTIEMLSLIHSQKSEVAKRIDRNEESSAMMNLPKLPLNPNTCVSAPCTTLVVAPMSLLAQWESEAEKASKAGSLRVLVYYGGDRSTNLQSLCCEANAAHAPNVIITSYGTVLSEFAQVASSGSGGSSRYSHGGLFSVEYFRIILDEAHNIKNRLSKTAKACYELYGKHRWVLTGTPIVNRLEDLFSLVHFLRVEPWSNFSFWKTFITVPFESKDYMKALDVVQTVLEPLVLRRTKDMKTPDGHPLVPLPPKAIDIERLELSKEEREVYDLIYARAKRTLAANVEAGTLMKSYTTIFAQILRLRQSCCHPVLTRNKDIISDEEEAAAAADIANGLADDMDLAALIERFQMEEGEQDANKFGAHALKQIQEEAENECPICSEEPMIEQAVTAGCWHSACKKCLIDYIDHQKDKMELPRCVTCREPVTLRDLFAVVRHDEGAEASSQYTDTSSPPPNEDGGEAEVPRATDEQSEPPRITLRRLNQPSSSKITALVSHLKSVRRTEPQTKSVVFSQFTSFLDLIEPALDYARIPYLRFDGTMAQKQRAEVLARFAALSSSSTMEEPLSSTTRAAAAAAASPPLSLHRRGSGKVSNTPVVLLLSLRAGGVGLNLTCAQRVYMMDPWWSWAVEAQAIDRVHRMGQTQPVKVVRFVCQQSIEEKMLKVQDRKKFIASSLGMMSEEEKRAQRLEDIRELLS